jgi:cytochrome c oxidase subunit 3
MATLNPTLSMPGYYERLRRYRLGVAIGLASIVMIFVALTSAYVVRQGLSQWDEHQRAYVSDWHPVPLPLALLLVNTAVLLLSSFTLERARRNLMHRSVTATLADIPGVAPDPERSLPWLGVTVVLGAGFLAGQFAAWHELHRAGYFLATTPSSSFFYVLTAAHGVHLTGGIIALLYAASTSLLHRSLATRRIVVDATAWYWHFMAALWLYIFGLLYFVR